MPYIPHLLYSFRGTLGPVGVPLETFSFGIRFGIPGVANPTLPAMTQGHVDAAHSAFNTLMTTAIMSFTEDARTAFVKGYEIGADGDITAEPKVSGGTVAVGPSTNDIPWQNSLAVTLFTGGLGKGRFGRFYLPPEHYTSGSDGLLTSATAVSRLASIHTFMTALEATFSATPTVKAIVASQTGLLGSNRQVTVLRLGRVVDTQRRRRRSLSEAYVTLPFGGS